MKKIWVVIYEVQYGADGESEIDDVQVFTEQPDNSILHNDTRWVSIFEKEIEL